MRPIEKTLTRLGIAMLFSILNWILIDYLIIDISFFRYFIVELLLVISLKLYTFILHFTKLI
jgi:hypothetical protein